MMRQFALTVKEQHRKVKFNPNERNVHERLIRTIRQDIIDGTDCSEIYSDIVQSIGHYLLDSDK